MPKMGFSGYFTAYTKLKSDFKPLQKIFPDGIPVLFIQKIEGKLSDEITYFWEIPEEVLTEEEKVKTYEFFAILNGLSIEKLTSTQLTIPNTSLRMVLSRSLEKIDIELEYFKQLVFKQATLNKDNFKVSFNYTQLHLVNVSCCLAIASKAFEEYHLCLIKDASDSFTEFLTENCEELKTFYEEIKKGTLTKNLTRHKE
ncbi:hypothetical protein [Aphanothece sacrum]|uniref:Uncharacterized protein n=1 Tax=Aphanothece sacrum FPU1 TaxID=1920663 RepID=A0A401IEQ1_APHSA|nr:hypothetical protein [Aphanothece sacrum]GBF79711.1 hypothetical protein AsFPU1_1110 [Aphanothece sacrum FPU1]GBF87173.1 hypothetical protein AsFPU3_4255 [Aphanothece sacrum FPU3]